MKMSALLLCLGGATACAVAAAAAAPEGANAPPADRLHELEQRVQALEAAGAAAPQSAPAGSDNRAFNPALSLILQGRYAAFSRDPAGYALPGFDLAAEAGPGDQGWSLGESELVASANVDPNFYGRFTLALASDGGADVEEAYFQTLTLPAGLTLRAGRFFAGIGYLNEQHPHQWDFVDEPLVYRALLGGQYGDEGLRLRWLAPSDRFLELGAELLRGSGFPAGGASHDGNGAYTLSVHTGGDVGFSHAWRAGFSCLNADAADRAGSAGRGFSGHSRVYVADLVWKWAPQGNPYRHYAQLQGEYLLRDEDGAYGATPYRGTQRGWYLQGVYQFVPRWRAGLRYGTVKADDPGAAYAGTPLEPAGHRPQRTSVMVDYSNSEYSRLRLQYSRDASQPTLDHRVFLEYIMSLGAHGAHQF